jgi:hypothetical protein
MEGTVKVPAEAGAMHRKTMPGLVALGPSGPPTEEVALMATKPLPAPVQVTVKSFERSMLVMEVAFELNSAGTAKADENEPTALPPDPDKV